MTDTRTASSSESASGIGGRKRFRIRPSLVAVCCFDFLFIFGLDLLSLDLLSRRNQAILGSPLFVCHDQTINELDPGQSRLTTGFLHLSQDDAVELLVMNHFF